MKAVWWGVVNILGVALLLAGLFFTTTSVYESVSPEKQATLLNSFKETPFTTSKDALLFTYAYMSVTPSLYYEWIGDPDRQILFVEQLPLLDKTDVFIIFLTILVLISMGSWAWNNLPYSPGQKLLGILAGFILVLVVVLLVYKALMFGLMNSAGANLGLSAAEIEQIRLTEFQNTMEVYDFKTYLGISFFTAGILLIGLFNKRKE